MGAGSGAVGDKDARIAAIVLAGGSSRRFGRANKLLADIDGRSLLHRVVERVVASRAGLVIIVTGHDRAAIEAAVAGLAVTCVHNPRHLEGMGHTVAAGIQALPETVALAAITPGDLPDVSTELINRLLAVATGTGGERIVYPTLPTGEQRNPVVWPRRFFPELVALTGDAGARHLLKQKSAETLPVPMTPLEAFADIDRPEDLEAWRKRAVRPAKD